MVEKSHTLTEPPEFNEASNAAFWNARYVESNTRWNLNEPAPPFVHLLKEREADFPPGRLAVVGSGHGHDAALFGQHGFDVKGFDIAPVAVSLATERYSDVATFVLADLFNLPTEYHGQFDYVVEHTCFCAIEPERREDYVNAVAQLLKPGGRLIGLFWAHLASGGPPYRTSRQEVFDLFSPQFEIAELTKTPHSTPSRQNEEYLGVLLKKVFN